MSKVYNKYSFKVANIKIWWEMATVIQKPMIYIVLLIGMTAAIKIY